MPVRSVSVFLRANVTGFVAGMRAAQGSVVGVGRSVSRLESTVQGSTGRQAKAFQRLGRAGTIMAVGLVGAYALATKAAMDFDRQLSAVQAASNATAAQMKQLREAALQAGRTTAFSATQAAKAQEELVKAGVSVKDIMSGGLKGALDLASAGTLEVGESAEVAATAMTQFGLAGKDIPHIADLLSAGANKAQGTVHQLGFAMRMGGLVGAQYGLTIEDTVGTLASFASAGLIGSDAGTSFKTMLLHLGAPTSKASNLMKELGINAYDTSGQFVGIAALAENLRQKLSGLTQAERDHALAQIFGTDAVRGANILYRQGGEGIQQWINKVNDSGNASRTAATKLNNLSGDLTKLKGAFTTALIGAGEGGQGPLRDLVQTVTGLVNAFNRLPPSAQSSIIVIAGVTGAALLSAKALVFLVTTAKDARIALAALGVTGERVGKSMLAIRGALASSAAFMLGPWGAAVAAGVTVLALWASSKKDATHATEEFTNAIQADSGAMGANTRAAVANRLEKEGLLKIARDFGLNLGQVTDAILGNKAAQQQLNQQMDDYYEALRRSGKGDKETGALMARRYLEAEKLKKAIAQQNGEVNKSAQAAKRQADATAATATSQRQAATAATVHTRSETELSTALTDASKSADDLQKALDKLSSANMDADRAAIAQAKSTKSASEASDHRRGLTLDERSALLDLADANQKLLVKKKEEGVSAAQLEALQRRLTNQFIRQAVALGLDRKEAARLAERYAQLKPIVQQAGSAVGGFIARVTAAAGAQQRLAARTGGGSNAMAVYTSKVKAALPVLYTLAGRNQAAKAQVDRLAASAGVVGNRMDITKPKFLQVAAAMGIATSRANALWKEFAKIHSKTVDLKVYAEGLWTTAHDPGRRIPGLAKGGPVPFTSGAVAGQDSVPALLMPEEHVWTTREVEAVGGHDAMYRLRSAAMAGQLKGYASGGRVSMTSGASTAAVTGAVMAPIRAGWQSMFAAIADTMAAEWKKFAQSGGPVVAAARSQIGLPYSWGGGGLGGPSYGIGRGAGTYGFDCSGLTQYAWGQGRGIDIGGTTVPQWANSTPISGPRPGALAFPSGPNVHVMLGSSKPGYVIQAPFTGSFVQEVPRSSGNWRWPTAAGMAAGGPVRRLGEFATGGRADADAIALAKLLQVSGSGPRGAERHTAQVARAGEMRLWAEPETGGEAYIPLAPSKRLRSKAVLASVARRFGMSVTGMADGGITGFADGGSDTDLNLGDILSRWADTVHPATKSDVDEAIKNRKTQADQVAAAKRALAKAEKSRRQRIADAEKRLRRAYASHGKGRANRIEDAKDALRKARDTDRIRDAERKLTKERNDLNDATKRLKDTERRYQFTRQSPATQLGSALSLGIKNTGAFISNLTRLSDRGFGVLARQLLAMGGPEAEKIAADAVKFSDAKLRGLEGQLKTSQGQANTLAHMDDILNARSAIKSGKGTSWVALLNATGLDPGALAAALKLMPDLAKSASGKALLADMKAHGYAAGGWISGAGGIDRVPIMATHGEFMIQRRQASKYGPLVEAINSDRVGDALLRRYSRGTGVRAHSGDGAMGGGPHIENHFHHPEMDVHQLSRESAREMAWAIR